MDYTQRNLGRSSSESSTIHYAGAKKFNSLHFSKGNNYNSGKMYSTKQSLSVDNMADQPKKGSFLQTIYKGATSLFVEPLSRTSSIMKNWSNMNAPLSVTVVSPELVSSLQQGSDHQLVNTNGFYTAKIWSRDSTNCDEKTMPTVLYHNEILNSDSVMKCNNISDSNNSDSERRWKEYKSMYVDFNGTHEKDLIKNQEDINSMNLDNSDLNKDNLLIESHFNTVVVDETEMDRSMNFANTLDIDQDESIIKLEKPVISSQTNHRQQQQQQQQNAEEESHQPTAAVVTTLLTNAYNTVINGTKCVADLLQLRSNSPVNNRAAAVEPPEEILFTTKRACTSPKPRPKKLSNISSGRGRGRAKSQLRRSGVSQTRHRKERSRYDQSEEIKSDIDNWEELEYCNVIEEDETFEDLDMDVCDCAPRPATCINNDNDDDQLLQYYKHTSAATNFTLADVKPHKRKLKIGKNNNHNSNNAGDGISCGNGNWSQLSLSISVQSLDDSGEIDTSCTDKLSFRRPRLLSESSVDSEDSYCIVFEDNDDQDDDSDDPDYETEDESSFDDDDSESESEADDEDKDLESDKDMEIHSVKKVRFNPKPVIHNMIAWKFAYKAARISPWPQIGRDRVRFCMRINNIGHIVEPILESQHRLRIWHERFED